MWELGNSEPKAVDGCVDKRLLQRRPRRNRVRIQVRHVAAIGLDWTRQKFPSSDHTQFPSLSSDPIFTGIDNPESTRIFSAPWFVLHT
jgi:hypothetical protein